MNTERKIVNANNDFTLSLKAKFPFSNLLIVLVLFVLPFGAFAENIDPDNDGSQYAWGENVGWLNLEPGGDGGVGVDVGDAILTGYIWGENVGWINMSPLFGGVVNDGIGNLSGYAWGENVGWINFDPIGGGVYIDACGDFNGYAWGENIGWISFRSDGPNWFYVRTSWTSPVDTIPPVTVTTSPILDWYTTDTSIGLSATDCGSGVQEVHYSIDAGAGVVTPGSTATASFTTDGCHDFSYFSIDWEANIEPASQDTVCVDKTLPVINITSPADGTTYSYYEVVLVDYTVTDPISGISIATSTVPDGSPVDTSSSGSHTFTVSATDVAGNSNSVSHTYTIPVDVTPPSITITTPSDGATYFINQGVIVDYSVTDSESGIDVITAPVNSGGPVDTSSEGSFAFTVSASDIEGNNNSLTHNYSVVYPGNIDPDGDGSRYAWGENVGWINFKPSWGPGITMSDTAVTGMAWGENIGWINMSPTEGGVAVNGACLSGYAWGENVGWINFSPAGGGVFIDPATGVSSGYAWGENIGWINFAPNGVGIKTSWRGTADADQDCYTSDVDCDESDPNAYPGAPETPDDGIDQDCNGFDTITCVVDTDQDGYGTVLGTTVLADDGTCDTAQSESTTSDDCTDDNADIYPGAPETPDDGIDQDCNGFDTVTCVVDADQDGYGTVLGTTVLADDGTCDTAQSESTTSDDCTDDNADIYPGALETPDDGIDQNCDGFDTVTCVVDADQDGYGTVLGTTVLADDGTCDTAQSESTTSDDCKDDEAAIYPGALEIPGDGIDQDCSGSDFITTFAYISNRGDNTVSVINTFTNTVIDTIPVGNGPYGVAVNPTGTRVYVANYLDNTVSVIDTSTHTVIATIPVGLHPSGLAVNRAATRVYVINSDGNSISVIDTDTHTVLKTIPVIFPTSGIAVSPAGIAYVSSMIEVDGLVNVIDTSTDTYVTNVWLGMGSAEGIAVNRAGTLAYAALMTYSGASVSVIDTADNSVAATIPVSFPLGVSVSPDDTRLYITGNDQLSVVNTSNNSVIDTVSVGSEPSGVSVEPGGERVYVANSLDNTVSVVDTSTNTVMATVPAGSHPMAFGQFIQTALPLETDMSVIDSGGGTISSETPSSSDPVEAELTVPALALSESTTVMIREYSASDPSLPQSPLASFSRIFQFTPEGLTFNTPVTMVLKYHDDEVIGKDETSIQVHLLDGGEYVILPDCLTSNPPVPDPCVFSRDTAGNSVTIKTTHFSMHTLTPDPIVNMPDANLKSAIAETLGVSNPTYADILTMTSLDASNRGITDLTGLEYAKNLTVLNLSDNQISDISPLAGLTQLAELFLHNNQLTGSIPTFIFNLINLTYLDLSYNQLTGSIPTEINRLTSLTYLDLTDNQLRGSIPTEIGNLTAMTRFSLQANQLTGSIPTSISNLKALTYLNLADNQLSSSIPTQIGQLTALTYLHLNTNQFTGSIPTEIGNLTALTSLILYTNQLTGSIPTSIGNLKALTFLSLGNNQLSGSIPTQIGQLRALTYLHLNTNQFTGNIPTEIGNLQNLSHLYLQSNELSGSIPIEIGNLTALTQLILHNNQLTGSIPATMGNLTSLTQLALEYNHLTDSIPASFGNLIALTNLNFAYNHISDISALAALLDLDTVYLGGNCISDFSPVSHVPNVYGTAEQGQDTDSDGICDSIDPDDDNDGFSDDIEIASGTDPLDNLSAPADDDGDFIPDDGDNSGDPNDNYCTGGETVGCDDNCQGVNNPEQADLDNDGVGNACDADIVVFNDANLKEAVEGELGVLNPTQADMYILINLTADNRGITDLTGLEYAVNLTDLRLQKNQITGSIPAFIFNLTNLTYVDLSYNQLTGGIPIEIDQLTELTSLSLGVNQLTGGVPTEIGTLKALTFLALNYNQLSGSIPVSIGNLTALSHLYLNSNQLSGSIPPSIGNLTALNWLFLSDNQLTGHIPAELGNLTSLAVLYLNKNKLSGSIPTSIGNLNVLVLALNSNQLTGAIPKEIGNISSLNTLSLSTNQLTGSIPAEIWNLTSLTNLGLGNNQLSGTIPPEIGNLTSLTVLELRNNQLTGSIPPEIGTLKNLNSIHLDQNQLTGNIPTSIGNLTALVTLNLFSNQLSGSIPPEIGNLIGLKKLYMFNNQLTGSIPAVIGNLTALDYLNLGDNQLSGTIPPEIGNLTALTQLYLFGNQLTGNIPTEIGSLTALTSLGLNYNQFTGSIPASMGNLTSLTQLGLDYNQLAGSIPAALGNLTALTRLNIDYNHISDVSALATLLYLDTVYLGGNCIADFSPVSHVPNVYGMTIQRPDTDSDGICDSIDPDDDNDGFSDDIEIASGTDPLDNLSVPADDDGDLIPDDGDNSGIVGDNPCTGGNIVGCDDNCQGVNNPEQADDDNDGIGDACDSCTDGDGDGYGSTVSDISGCPGSAVLYDCDDDYSSANPGNTNDATCDGVDDDCDGTADDDYVIDSSCGVGYCNTTNTPSSCEGGVETICTPGTPLDSAADDVGYEVAIDAEGNLYITGSTNGALDGNVGLGGDDVFVSKYHSWGARQWTDQFGTAHTDLGSGIATDAYGNVYVTGHHKEDIFVTKYDSAGVRQWTDLFAGGGAQRGQGITTDPLGNVYITGYTYGDLDGNPVAGSSDIFVSKYDPSGARRWTRLLGSSSLDKSFVIAADTSGNVYVSGYTMGGLDGHTNAGDWDIFVTKYDSTGEKQWTRQPGTAAKDYGAGITVDASGYVYITGATYGDLDGNTNAGSTDIFIMKYDSLGNKLWTKLFGTRSGDGGYGIAVDASGNMYITGATMRGLDGHTNAGGWDVFVTKYDPWLTRLWTDQLGTSGDDISTGIALDIWGNAYVTGHTLGGLDGNTSEGLEDIFLIKYDSSGARQWTEQFGTPTEGTCDGIDGDCDGTVDENYVSIITSCGVGACEGNVGSTSCVEGTVQDSCDPYEGATDETCNGIDDNCDDIVDEDFADTDGDEIANCVDTDPVHIPDPNLKLAIEEILGPDPTQADMYTLTFLDASNLGITDLTGLEYATNLTVLKLSFNQISNISALSELTNLIDLYLGSNQISDITALAGLTNLTYLRLNNNQINDILPLSGLINLGELLLSNNQISDIFALSVLKSLVWLTLQDNQISDITALSGLTKLTALYLHNNKITDISALAGLSSLTELYLHNNQITDISPLINLQILTNLTLQTNPLNTSAYCNDLPLIESNNPGISITYDPSSDFDNDGIQNEVDLERCVYSNWFDDLLIGGTTYGNIVERGDHIVTVSEEPNPSGVLIAAEPTGGLLQGAISVCGHIVTFLLTAGDSAVITCGSVTIEVISGTIEATFVADDGTTATAALPQNNTVTFEPADKTFEAPATNVDTVIVVVEGTEVPVDPGETGFAVSIDIKPGDVQNSINLGAEGVIPVAILTTPDFDATTVDPATVKLEGTAVNIAGKSDKYQAAHEDVDGDGDMDLIVQIINQLNLVEGDAVAHLEGKTFGGLSVHGQDTVRVVP